MNSTGYLMHANPAGWAALRNERGDSLRDLALTLGVSRRFLRRVVSGRRTVSSDFVARTVVSLQDGEVFGRLFTLGVP